MPELAERLQAALGPGYRVERELGGGGMSRVFVAEEVELGRKVVVKVLPPEMARGVSADRFRREIQLAASLQHPHIVQLLAAGHSADLVWYTMPLIEGESLRTRLAREGELPVPEVVRLLRDVADALAYAHQHGVVHRDVKPDNVLLEGQHAVVTDFGVAKAVAAATAEASLTSIGVALGTPAYMAPEQAAAQPNVDHRADVYALGVMAYEMLTGAPPFSGDAQLVLAAHVTRSPEAVTARRAAVPAALGALVMRCLEKKPADRWQSAADLHQQLDVMATPSGGMAPTGAVPAFLGRAWRGRARRRAIAAAGLVRLAALAYGAFRVLGNRGVDGGRSIAVLTFETIGADTGAAYLAEGLADGISTSLSGLARLKVVSRTAVRRMAEASRVTPAQLGEALGAASLVGGSIQRSGGRLRVTVELVRASSGEQLWTARYDTTTLDVLGVQTLIAEAVAGSVAGRLLPAERTHVARRPTPDREAYDQYLRGNRLRRNEDDRSTLAAIGYYEAALRRDSSFTAARARLADAYGAALNWDYRPGGLSRDSVLATGLAAAARALAEDSASAEAWMARGYVLQMRGGAGDWDASLDAYRRAVALDPMNTVARDSYAAVLRRLGRFDESEREYLRTLAIDSLDVGAMGDLAFLAMSRRSFPEALRWYERAYATEPAVAFIATFEARARSLSGDRAGALRASQRALDLSTDAERLRALAALAEVEARAGDRASATAHLREALHRLGVSGRTLPAVLGVRNAFDCALAATALADHDLALTILERIRPRGPWLWSYLVLPGFDPIRRDPRFRKIIDEARPPGAKDPV